MPPLSHCYFLLFAHSLGLRNKCLPTEINILLGTSQAALVWQEGRATEQEELLLPLEASGSSRKSVTKVDHAFTGRKALCFAGLIHPFPLWTGLKMGNGGGI